MCSIDFIEVQQKGSEVAYKASEVMLRISEVRQKSSEVAYKASEVMLRISEVRQSRSEVFASEQLRNVFVPKT